MSRTLVICSILWAAAGMTVRAQPVSFVRADGLFAPTTGYVPFVDAAVDMDGDFRDDVVRVSREGIFVDFQDPAGSFTRRFFPLPVEVLPTWSICAGDLDNDGYNDLLLAGDSAVSFVLARDLGLRYAEWVMPGYLLSQRSTLADIDRDGWLDGFVCNDKGRSVPYRNTGDGHLQPDTLLVRTADRAGNYAAIWTDYDNDGDADLYISKCQAGAPPGHINRTNLLYRNNGDGSFTEVAEAAGIADNAQSWATVFEDFDHDGDFDAFVINHDEANRLYRNNGDGTFTDVIAASGIDPLDFGAFENAAGDFNNDGHVDIFAQLRQELYLGHGDLTFTGIDAPVFPGAIADLNADGWLDVFRLDQAWINQAGDNHWFKVGLIGMAGNRSGIGARIEIHGEWGRQVREVRAGQSYTPMSSLNVHFGLGSASHVDSLIVAWSSGMRTILRDIPSDTLMILAEAPCNREMVEVSLSGPPYLCAGDTLRLSAPAGFAAYRWVHGPEGMDLAVSTPGTYRVMCQDSMGCISVSREVRIRARRDERPTILAPEGLLVCPGDTISLIVNGGGNASWSTGAEDLPSIRVADPGVYTASVEGVCDNTWLASEPVLVERIPVDPPVAGEIMFLPGDSVRLSAAGENCHWFDQPEGGSLFAVGCVWATARPDTAMTYYVESHVDVRPAPQAGGKADTTGQGGLPLQNGHMVFEAFMPFILESVTVYLPAGMPAGVRFIQLWSRDSLVAFRRFDVVEGANILPLDLAVDTGEYLLVCPQGNLFRNTGQLDYPYPLGDLGRITASSTGQDAYFYFYDWRISALPVQCVSERTPVEVLVADAGHADDPPDVTVFPMPTEGILHIRIPATAHVFEGYEVSDYRGRLLAAGSLDDGREAIVDLSSWPDGFYVLRLSGPGGAIVRPVAKISRFSP